MEIYRKLTPLRSNQSAANLMKLLKNKQKDELERARSKSVIEVGTTSDDYGYIPNLRSPVEKRLKPYRIKNNPSSKFERRSYSTLPVSQDFVIQD